MFAYQNYAKTVDGMEKGIRFDDDERIPPNYPPGYRYEEWDIEHIIADKQAGKDTDLGPGDWE